MRVERLLLVPLLAVLVSACHEPERTPAPAARAYCAQLEGPEIRTRLDAAAAMASRAARDGVGEEDARERFCRQLTESLASAEGFFEGARLARRIAQDVSGRALPDVMGSTSRIEADLTEAEVSCREGELAALDALVSHLRSELLADVRRARRQCRARERSHRQRGD
jgi:hypothetical protein